MAVQITVSPDYVRTLPGMVERTTKTPVVLSRLVDQANGIPAGVFVTRNGHDRKVKLPAATGDVTKPLSGFAILDPVRVYNAQGHANGEDVGVLVEGVIAVVCEEAVVQGEPVFVRHTANGANTQLGAVRNDDDAVATVASCTKLPGAYFFESAAAGGAVRIYLSQV